MASEVGVEATTVQPSAAGGKSESAAWKPTAVFIVDILGATTGILIVITGTIRIPRKCPVTATIYERLQPRFERRLPPPSAAFAKRENPINCQPANPIKQRTWR